MWLPDEKQAWGWEINKSHLGSGWKHLMCVIHMPKHKQRRWIPTQHWSHTIQAEWLCQIKGGCFTGRAATRPFVAWTGATAGSRPTLRGENHIQLIWNISTLTPPRWSAFYKLIGAARFLSPSHFPPQCRRSPPAESDDRRQPGRGLWADPASPTGGDSGGHHGHQVPEHCGRNSDRAPWEGK